MQQKSQIFSWKLAVRCSGIARFVFEWKLLVINVTYYGQMVKTLHSEQVQIKNEQDLKEMPYNRQHIPRNILLET